MAMNRLINKMNNKKVAVQNVIFARFEASSKNVQSSILAYNKYLQNTSTVSLLFVQARLVKMLIIK